MNSFALALMVSLALSAPFSPAVTAAAVPERPAVQAREAVPEVPEVPKVYPSSPEGAPVTYEFRLPVLMYHHVALPEKPVLITFDDGYRSNYELAYPLLQKYQARAAIAIMVYMQDNWAEGFLSWDMCREMTASGLVEIGSHGYAIHNLDGRMGNFAAGQANGVQRRKGESDDDFYCRVLEDLRYSHQRIAMELGTAPSFFAYPFGKTDPDADAYLKSLFPVTVVTGPGKYAADLSKGLWQLPRFTVTMKAEPKTLLKGI